MIITDTDILTTCRSHAEGMFFRGRFDLGHFGLGRFGPGHIGQAFFPQDRTFWPEFYDINWI